MPEKQETSSAKQPAEKNKGTKRRVARSKVDSAANNELQKKAKSSSSTTSAKQAVDAYPAPETVGGHESAGSSHRRRHKTHHSKGGSAAVSTLAASVPHPGIRTEELIRRAWKIYLGEVTEEGLALMDDRTAEETAQRAFRVAEIFLLCAASYGGNSEPSV